NVSSGDASSPIPRFTRLFNTLPAFNIQACAGLSPTTTTLVSTPSSSATFGQQVTLTATVSPVAATGKVTFYDGTTVLGVGTLASGQAVLKTMFLAAGNRLLTARYGADTTFAPSLSTAVALMVNANPGGTFAAVTGSPFATG